MKPVPPEKLEKRYPIGLIGTHSTKKIGEKVSNRPYWNPFHRKNRRKGFQSALLEPVPPEKSEKRYPISLIGTRSTGKIREKVSNRPYWNPFHRIFYKSKSAQIMQQPLPKVRITGSIVAFNRLGHTV
ncbi:hypothetical protein [Neobacillus soli]|uniref:hypothetical protein n=1 Tax=Neobacillus soli TaxID=220688 RepID=UPI000ACF14F0|nr:hypothetical protein [Neobacillus soli]